MITSILGNVSLILAFILMVIGLARPAFLKLTVIGQFLAITLSFGCLIYSFITSNLEIKLVSFHSHPFLPLFYKIAASWGNHEGSMLLWLWITSLYNVILYQLLSDKKPIYVQFLISCGLILYIVLTSNPFLINHTPHYAFGLNPILQDIALAIHPPILYLGYVGFAPVFSYGIYLLTQEETQQHHWATLQLLACVAWSFLTLGIVIGSWWAYRELGWGGFWFWDPVENAALIPWLTGLTLIHSNLITIRKSTLKIWTIFLAILTFILCLISSFLVRSGILSSVHSFAADSNRGIFIFIYILFLILFAVYSFIQGFKKHNPLPVKLSTIYQMILVNNILFIASAFTILFATIFPLFYNFLFNESIAVAAPYFNSTILPIFIISSILLALTNFIPKGNNIKLSIVVITTIIISYLMNKYNSLSILEAGGFLIGLFLIISMISEFYRRYNYSHLSSSFIRAFIAHLAVGIITLSISINSNLSLEYNLHLKDKEEFKFKNFTLKLNKIEFEAQKNYFTKKAFFTLYKDLNEKAKLIPEIRLYPIEQNQNLETSIYHHLLYDIYLAISDIGAEDQVKLLIYYRPVISWIWISSILIACAGFLSVYYYSKKKNY